MVRSWPDVTSDARRRLKIRPAAALPNRESVVGYNVQAAVDTVRRKQTRADGKCQIGCPFQLQRFMRGELRILQRGSA